MPRSRSRYAPAAGRSPRRFTDGFYGGRGLFSPSQEPSRRGRKIWGDPVRVRRLSRVEIEGERLYGEQSWMLGYSHRVLIASTHRTRRKRNTESTTLSLYYLWRGCDAYLLYCTIYCARRVVLRSMLYVPCTDDLFRRKKRDDEWTTSLTVIDRREQCFICISGCKIRTLPMRIEMYLGCIQKSSHLVRDSPGRPRPKASVCFSVFYIY